MKPDLIQATLDGRKTETRRLRGLAWMNIEPENWDVDDVGPGKYVVHSKVSHFFPASPWPTRLLNRGGNVVLKCPYGAVGDRLYVMEKWRVNSVGCYCLEHKAQHVIEIEYGTLPGDARGDTRLMCPTKGLSLAKAKKYWNKHQDNRYTSSRYMPKAAARIWLEITGERLERLQDITDIGCLHEGVRNVDHVDGYYWEFEGFQAVTVRWALECGWDKINPAYPWSLNPWVWVVQWKLESKLA